MINSYGFNGERQRKARQYFYSGLSVSLCKGIAIFVLTLLGLHLRCSIALEDFVRTYVSELWQVIALFFLIGYIIFWLVSLPFDYCKDYVIEHKFELSTETRGGWFIDKIKTIILYGLFMFSFVEGAYQFMADHLTYWWLLTWLVSSIFIIFFMYVSPVLIMPLFYKFPKLKDEALINRLTNLAKKVGIKIVGVFEMKAGTKTKKAIGALTGIGNTRRMLLSDTLLQNFSHDEIEVVMGHELGHHVYHHIEKLTVMLLAFSFLVLFIIDQVLRAAGGFFGFEPFSSIASLTLFALTLGLCFVVSTPLVNSLSRWIEGHCDQYDLDLVENPDAYISTMIKLCDQNLRYVYPHPVIEFLFYDHPSGKHRMERAHACMHQPTK